jgi:hypothetical protein
VDEAKNLKLNSGSAGTTEAEPIRFARHPSLTMRVSSSS